MTRASYQQDNHQLFLLLEAVRGVELFYLKFNLQGLTHTRGISTLPHVEPTLECICACFTSGQPPTLSFIGSGAGCRAFLSAIQFTDG